MMEKEDYYTIFRGARDILDMSEKDAFIDTIEKFEMLKDFENKKNIIFGFGCGVLFVTAIHAIFLFF